MVARVGRGEPLAAGRRSGGGRWLGGRVAAVSSSGDCGGDGGVGDGRRLDVHMGILEEVDGGRHRLAPWRYLVAGSWASGHGSRMRTEHEDEGPGMAALALGATAPTMQRQQARRA
jgi:hypothetical protein